MTHGIDISGYQGDVDFEKVKQSGIDFVIIKAGEQYAESKSFSANYAKAKAAGLHVGAYWFSRAMSAEDAQAEAECCVKTISGKQFDYPIYYDLEDPKQFEKGKDVCSKIVDTFCKALEDSQYYPGLYMSRFPLQAYISEEVARRYALWIAEYATECGYSGDFGLWQRSGSGSCPGINGSVDLDNGYVDYPSIIKRAGLNGYGK